MDREKLFRMALEAGILKRLFEDEFIMSGASLARLAELLAEQFANDVFNGITGCGDHSCYIKKPVGMGTNGGCRCVDKRAIAGIVISRVSAIRKGK